VTTADLSTSTFVLLIVSLPRKSNSSCYRDIWCLPTEMSCQCFVSRVGGVSAPESLSTLRMLNIVRLFTQVAASVRSTTVKDCSFSKRSWYRCNHPLIKSVMEPSSISTCRLFATSYRCAYSMHVSIQQTHAWLAPFSVNFNMENIFDPEIWNCGLNLAVKLLCKLQYHYRCKSQFNINIFIFYTRYIRAVQSGPNNIDF